MDTKTPKMSDFWENSKKVQNFLKVNIDDAIRFLSMSDIAMIFIFPVSHRRAKTSKDLALRR